MKGDKNITYYITRYRSKSTFFLSNNDTPQEFERSSLEFKRKHVTGVTSAGVEGYVEDGDKGGCSVRRGWSVEIACVYKANGLKITERRAPWASRGESERWAHEGGPRVKLRARKRRRKRGGMKL